MSTPLGARPAGRLVCAVALGAALLGVAAPAPGLPSDPPPEPTAQVRAAPPLGPARPVGIRIPAIAVDSAVVALGLQADGTLQVPADGSVAGWFTGGPTPGATGPAVVAAHVDWDHRPGVFARLRDLRRGDEVDVTRDDGTTARFTVLAVDRYPKDAFPTDWVYGDVGYPGLRLITCGGDFDHAAHSYRDNVVVYAGLIGAVR